MVLSRPQIRWLWLLLIAPSAAAAEGTTGDEPRGRGAISELNLGLTRGDLSDVPVAFDARLGWVARGWSAEAYGARSYTKTRPDGRIDKLMRWNAGAAARWLPGDAEDALRFELRFEGAYADFQDGWMSMNTSQREFESMFSLRRVDFRGRPDAPPVDSDWTIVDSRELMIRGRMNLDLEPLSSSASCRASSAGSM